MPSIRAPATKKTTTLTVAVKCRPLMEKERGRYIVRVNNSKEVIVLDPDLSKDYFDRIQNRTKEKKYYFDHAFGPESTDKNVYRSMSSVISGVVHGLNATVFAYGSTGSLVDVMCLLYFGIQKFVQFQLTVNVVALIINFVSACITGSAPLTVVQLLWVNMIMDTLGALALATEPPNEGLIKGAPIARTASFITKTMWRNIAGQSVCQLIVLGILNFAGKSLLKVDGPDSTAILNTVIFNSFVFMQCLFVLL